MPRPRTLSDDAILREAFRLMQRGGPAGLSFGKLAKATGLSPATLVQRFGSKPALQSAALAWAWTGLEEQTGEVFETAPRSPEGARSALRALLGEADEGASPGDDLLLLREDLRDPALRARGRAWHGVLVRELADCLAAFPEADLLAAELLRYWQGSMIVRMFDEGRGFQGRVDEDVAAWLGRLSS